jgi:hypothetical protein
VNGYWAGSCTFDAKERLEKLWREEMAKAQGEWVPGVKNRPGIDWAKPYVECPAWKKA